MIKICSYCEKQFDTDEQREFNGCCSILCYSKNGMMPYGEKNAVKRFDKRHSRWVRRWKDIDTDKIRTRMNSRWVWERTNGKIPDDFEIHHIDCDQSNDDISNLMCIGRNTHRRIHKDIRRCLREK